MKSVILYSLHRALTAVLFVAIAFQSTGCATILREKTQSVTVATIPKGKSVFYNGVEIDDGGAITIERRFDQPKFYLGQSGTPVSTPVTYDPDLWLIGDAGLLFLGVVPGVIALGVDFGSGAWRKFHDRQQVIVPDLGPRPVAKPDKREPEARAEASVSSSELKHSIEP